MRRFRPYLRYLKAVRWPFIGGLACGAIFGFCSGFGLPVMLQKVFPIVFSPRILPRWEVIGCAALLPAIFLVRGIAGYINSYLINFCGVRVLEQIRTDYFTKLQQLPLAFFSRHSSGDLISRGMNDTNQLQNTITTVASEVVKQPTTLLSALAALTYLSFQNKNVVFVLLCLALVPAMVFPIRVIGKNLLKRAMQMQGQMGNVTNHLSENLGALKEVRAFGLEQREVNRFQDSVRSLFTYQMKVVKYGNALSPIIEFLSTLGVGAALLYSHHVHLPWETFLAMVGALYLSYDPLKKIGVLSNELKRGEGALNRLEEILREPQTISDPVDPVPVGRLRGDVTFAGVTFAYKPDEPVLSGVSVQIPAGTVCALVGPSGAGKTTFANLVPRFYEAGAGAVAIDGIDVRAMRIADLRRNIALVSQDPVLFNDTIYNNLLLGRENATREEVMAAAVDAYADDFIRRLPSGYDTMVGERGALVSGGQRQRLAIARAFLRNAPILILDEATSALDSDSEAAIQRALKKLMAGKTVFIIAHRFSTSRDASLILVFEHGRIVADGTHDQLYAGNPLYRSLYDRQQGNYPAP